MDNWFRSKWFVRVVSLAFAVLFYVFVSVEVNNTSNSDSTFFPGRSEEVQILNDVPVNIRIDEENYVVSGVPEYVSVSLEGSAGVLTPTIRQRNFDVYVDLEGLEEGEHVVEVEHTISSDLSVLIEPKTIEVTIEERATEEFEVNVDFLNTNQLAEGYEIGEYEVNPTAVTITSSKSVIDQIGIVKVFVDVSGRDEAINNREVPVNVYDSQGNELNVNVQPENAVVSVEINNPSKTVPVSVETTGEMPEGYSLSSISANVDEVEIFATSNVLQDIEGITTEEIDLSEITESGTIDASLSLPDGASVPGMETIEVTIEVEETRTIEALPIDVEDVEEGQEVSFIEPDDSEMDITVVGRQSDVSELTVEDFRVFINLSGSDPGEHRVPITIEGPDDITTTGEFEQATVEISD